MSFSSDARNAFAQRKRLAPDLIPVPRYGDLYLLGLWCGHVIFSTCENVWVACPFCGEAGDMAMASVKVTRG
jgi:hypothetical protein